MFVKLNNNAVSTYPYTREMLENDFPNTSFPMDLTGVDLTDFEVAPVSPTEPPVVDHTKQVVEVNPVNGADGWVQTWSIIDAPAELEAEWTANAWSNLRAERNRLLTASDWTQVADAPVNQAAWAVYRQELRDLPDNTSDPFNPVWPEKPE